MRRGVYSIRAFLVTSGLFLLYSYADLHADSFPPSAPIRIWSTNEAYWGVTRITDDGRGRCLDVYAGRASDSNLHYSVRLINKDSPVDMFLSADGKNLVTLDDWAEVGTGINVLVLYAGSNLVSRFSLEELTSLSTEEIAQRVERTIHTRKWRDQYLGFFMQDNGKLLFCLWLDWLPVWMALDVETGQKIIVNSALKEKCHEKASEIARSVISYAANKQAGFLRIKCMRNDYETIMLRSAKAYLEKTAREELVPALHNKQTE